MPIDLDPGNSRWKYIFRQLKYRSLVRKITGYNKYVHNWKKIYIVDYNSLWGKIGKIFLYNILLIKNNSENDRLSLLFV